MAQLVILHSKGRDPMWEPVHVPIALLPIDLPCCGLGKQQRMAKVLGSLYPLPWDAQKMLLDPGFKSAQFQPLWSHME